jgi:hypothetical protein
MLLSHFSNYNQLREACGSSVAMMGSKHPFRCGRLKDAQQSLFHPCIPLGPGKLQVLNKCVFTEE